MTTPRDFDTTSDLYLRACRACYRLQLRGAGGTTILAAENLCERLRAAVLSCEVA